MEPGRHPLVLLALNLTAVAVGVAWFMPASLLDSRVAQATGGVLRVADTQGTLWHGRGVLTADQTRMPIEWDIDPWPMLQGTVRMRVRSDVGAGSPRGTVDLRTGEVALQDADVTVPAATIGRVLGDFAAGSVDGEVNANASNLHLASGSNSGEARLVWRNARVRGIGTAGALDLGEVRTTLVANGAAMSGPIANEGGSLALRGEWAVKEKDAFTLTLRVTPRKAGDADIARWLSAVGKPDGDGWLITWRLPLR